jgi:HEAT repeat protein
MRRLWKSWSGAAPSSYDLFSRQAIFHDSAMRKKWFLRILAFLLIAALGFVLLSPYYRQLVFGPRIQGVPLCAWQEQYRRQQQKQGLWEADPSFFDKVREWFRSKSVNAEAWKALGDAGKAQVLLSMIDDADVAMRKKIATDLHSLQPELAEQGLVRLFDDPDDEVREKALSGNVYSPARSAKLQELLRHPDARKRTFAVKWFAIIHWRDRESLDVSTGMLADSDASVRAEAALRLSLFWKGRRMGEESVPQLLAMLKDPDPICRVQAAFAAWCLGKNTGDTIPVLRQALKHEDEKVRRAAIGCFTQLKENGAPAFEDIVHAALHDPSIAIREVATRVLGHYGKKAIPTLLACLQSSAIEVRETTLYALVTIGPDAAEAAPLVLNHLEDLGGHACYWLRKMKPKTVTPQLIAMLDDEKANRSQVLEILGNIGPDARDAVPRLIALLDDEKADRSLVIETLGGIGPDAREAAPRLLQFVRDGHSARRAAVALARIQGNTDNVLPILLEMLDDADPFAPAPLRGWESFQGISGAPLTLDGLAPAFKGAIPELLRRLRTDEHPHKFEIAIILGDIGPDAEAAIPDLLSLLKAPVTEGAIKIHWAATYALGRIGKQPAIVVPVLAEALQNKYLGPRVPAIEALGNFGPGAQSAIPSLFPLLDGDELFYGGTVAPALAKIDPQRFPAKKLP